MTSNAPEDRPIYSQSSSNTNVLDAKTNPWVFHSLPLHWLVLFTFFVSRLLVNLPDRRRRSSAVASLFQIISLSLHRKERNSSWKLRVIFVNIASSAANCRPQHWRRHLSTRCTSMLPMKCKPSHVSGSSSANWNVWRRVQVKSSNVNWSTNANLWRWRTSASGCVTIPVQVHTTCTENTAIWRAHWPWPNAIEIWVRNIAPVPRPFKSWKLNAWKRKIADEFTSLNFMIRRSSECFRRSFSMQCIHCRFLFVQISHG